MYHIAQGEGKPLVFLHGFCETHSLWQQIVPYFSAQYRVYTPDLPGFGKSPLQVPGSLSIDKVATQLHDWLAREHISNPILVGHSLGGYILMSYLEQYPEQSAAVVLLHSNAMEDTELRKENRLRVLEFIKKQGVAKFIESFMPSLFNPVNREKHKALIAHMIAEASTIPYPTIEAYTLAMRSRPDRLPLLAAQQFPCLFIAGTEDQTIPLTASRQHQHLSTFVQYHELQGVGHMGMIEEQKQFIACLQGFLASVD